MQWLIAGTRFRTGYWAVALLCGVLALGVHLNARYALDTARRHYVQSSRAEAEAVAQKLEDGLMSIYATLRTIAVLDSVRGMDPSGSNLDARSRATIKQLFDNMAIGVPAPRILIAPDALGPDRSDAAAGREAAPALVFDVRPDPIESSGQTSAPSKPEAATPDESHQLRDQVAWLRRVMPTLDPARQSTVPLLSTPEIMTGDRTVARRTGVDADRAGLIFSVPLYGPDRALRGSVSAVMLSSALRKLMPQQNYALLNPGYRYRTAPSRAGQDRLSADAVERGVPDPTLIYSDCIVLSLPDLHSNWALWVGRPDRDFLDGSEAQSARLFERAGYVVVFGLLIIGLALMSLLRRNADLIALARARLELQVAERTAEILHMAAHDPLTGAANRTLLNETMLAWLADLRPGESLALMCIDLDRFKAVNDSFGHPAGDALLKAVTERIKGQIGGTDLVARLGGDEFAVLHRTPAGRAGVADLALSIINAIDTDFDLGAFQVRVGASVGIVLAPGNGTDPDQLVADADLALYRAKHDGRGRCRFFEPGMSGLPPEQRCSEHELRRAIEGEELVLHYQPLLDAGTQAIVGVEALVRWAHPQRGLVAPLDFIPLAEETGLIVPLGDWVVRQACRDAAQLPKSIKIAVNLSAAQFRSPGLSARVAAAIASYRLHPGRLELEITESRLLDDSAETLAILDGLKTLGVRLVLDDFGSGYSCLAHLGRFPLDKLKFDRAFMRDVDDHHRYAAIVKSVASLCAEFGIATTAEGIETPAQRDLAFRLGCIELQGYLFGRPMALADLLDRLGKDEAKAA